MFAQSKEASHDAKGEAFRGTKEADLEAILSLVPRGRLSVWVYLDKPNFAWLADRDKASPEVCARRCCSARI